MVKYFFLAFFFFFGSISTFAQITTEEEAFSAIGQSIGLLYDDELSESKALFNNGIGYFASQTSKRDSANWYDAHLEYGEHLVNVGQFQWSLDVFKKMHDAYDGAPENYIRLRIKNNLGFILSVLEYDEEAIPYLLDGLSLGMEATSSDSTYMARLHNNISVSYEILDQIDLAIKHMHEAIRLYELLGDTYRLSIAWSNISYNYIKLNLYDQAEQSLIKSIEYGELEEEDREVLANPYNFLANMYKNRGDFDKALIYLNKALEASKFAPSDRLQASPLHSIGILYISIGETDKAREFISRSLDINMRLNLPVSSASNHYGMARSYMVDDNFDEAKKHLDKAMESVLSASPSTDTFSLEQELIDIYIQQEDYASASMYANSLITRLQADPGFTDFKASTHRLLGQIYEQQNDYPKCLFHYRKSAELLKRVPLALRIPSLIDLSIAYRYNTSDSAFVIADSTFSLIERVRSNVHGTFQSGIFSSFSNFYKLVASWYIKDGDVSLAFALNEKAKARAFLEELNAANEALFSDVHDSLLVQKREKERNIDRLYNTQLSEADPIRKDSLEHVLTTHEFNYESFLQGLYSDIDGAKLTTEPRIISLKETQQLLSKGDGVLSYSIFADRLVSILVTPSKVYTSVYSSQHILDMDEYIAKLVFEYRTAILEKKNIAELDALSAALTDALFHDLPINEVDIKRMVLIPDGAIALLPFDALRINDEYLINKWLIKQLPSMSIYETIKVPQRDYQQNLLAFANPGLPDYSDNSDEATRSASGGIPFTITEVQEIAKIVPKSHVIAPSISERTFKALDLAQYRYLHFATHGQISTEHPRQSGLLLSENESLEDGFLNSSEISSLDVSADMVVLSACNTGNGKYISGEGLLGLQRSFLIAGSSSVVVSLWDIYDSSTAIFMTDFYGQMKSMEQAEYGLFEKFIDWFGWYTHPLFDYKAKALRQAKLNMLHSTYNNHPIHWAPFVYIGK